jgi:hypothetical protein
MPRAVLRQHGVPARGRIGFAGYFADDYWHDHVVVEAREQGPSGGRWRRFDPEVTEADGLVAGPMDLPTGPQSPFMTAAEAWLAWRSGDLDVTRFGAGPGVVPEGPWFLQDYVLRELAHLQGDELLLWDVWGAMSGPDAPIEDAVLAMTDEVAALLVAADAAEGVGDPAGSQGRTAGGNTARSRLGEWYRSDARLHPGGTILRFDPFAGPGEPPTPVELAPHDRSGEGVGFRMAGGRRVSSSGSPRHP